MSNIGTKIERLITEGFSYNTLRGLSESQVNLLYSRLINEVTMVSKDDTTTIQSLKTQKKPFEIYEDDDEDLINQDLSKKMTGQLPPEDQSDETNDGMDDDTNPNNRQENEVGMTEGEMTEKFESKAQQKLFWAKCNNSRTEKAKKKWCKWAKEFSDKTDFKKLPEKKLEEGLTKLVEKYIPESISKKELMSLIESSTRTKEAPGEKTREKETPSKPKRKNPFKIEPEQKPGPKALDEGGAGAPAKAPVKTPTKTPSKPQRKNPFKIEPEQKPGPKAKGPKWLSYDSFIKAGFNLK